MLGRTPVTFRLRRRAEQDRAAYRIAWEASEQCRGASAEASAAAAFPPAGREADTLAAAREASRHYAQAEQARDDLLVAMADEQRQRVARLGHRRGTLHQLLREYEREEKRGEHSYPEGSNSRTSAPAEYWLDWAWDAICSEHRELYTEPDPDVTAIMQAIGSSKRDRKIRGWVDTRIAEFKAQEAAAEAERQAFPDSYQRLEPSELDGPEPGTNEWYYERGYDPEPDWSTDPAVDWRHGLLYYDDGRVTTYDGTVIHEAVAEDESAAATRGRPAIEPGDPEPANAMRARWRAESTRDPDPTARQLADSAEHNARIDGLEFEAGC